MRNLKKLMAVVLAVVMVFALASVASAVGYADITDKDDITNTSAVALLVDLGVINGITQADGTTAYKPNDIVDRATMAKLISYVKIGDVDASVFAGTTTDLTDISGTWAEGYIKYCYANGIISGDGAGHFFPTTSVNVVAAAKMLLVALGYDPETQGYVGTNWAVNIMKDATTAGLLDGISASANTGLTRDDAALMIYNALNAKEAYYTNFTGDTVQFKNNTLGLATYGLQEIKGIVTGYTDDTTEITMSGNAYTLDIPGDPTLIGRKVKAYAEVKTTQTTANFVTSTTAVLSGTAYTVDDTISSACVMADKVLATSTNGTGLGALTDKTDSHYIGYAVDSALTTYVNGVKVDDAVSSVPTTGNFFDAVAKRGTEVQFVDTDADSKYDVAYATVYSLSYVVSTAAAKTGVEAKVTIKGIDGTINVIATGSDGAIVKSDVRGEFADLAKNDVVMVAIMGGGVANKVFVYEPTTFEGTMSKYVLSSSKTKTMTIDGTVYTTADIAALSEAKVGGLATALKTNGSAKFFVDKNGYIVAYDDVETTINYCAIDSAAWVEGSGVSATGYAQAKLVFTDGTTKVVTVAEIDGDEPVNDTPAFDGSAALADALSTTAATNNALFKGTTFTYKVNSDGEYELTTAYGCAKGSYGTAITSGISVISGSTAGNTSTIYVVKTTSGDTSKYTVYTSYKNVPSISGSNVIINVAKETSTSTFVAFVYVDATATGSTVGKTTNDYAYILSTDYATSGTDDELYEFSAMVDGEKITLTTESSSVATTLANSGNEAFFKVTYGTDGYVDAAVLYTGVAAYDTYAKMLADPSNISYFQGSAVATASGGVFRVKNAGDTTNTFFTYDGTEKVYIVDGTTVTVGEITDIDENDVVYVSVVDNTDDGADALALDTVVVVK